MPRNSSGTYTLPEVPFVPGTVIQSNPVNSNFSDIATALTQSLPTNGAAPMTGPLLLANGTVLAPSLAFNNSPGTGFYRVSDNVTGFAVGGVNALTIGTDSVFDFAAGIQLGNAAIADGDTLDWYEEGTFTPTISFGGGTTGITYTTQTGQFTRIGDQLFFTIVIVLSSKGSSTGSAYVDGLPYPPTSTFSLLNMSINNWTPPAGIIEMFARAYTGVSFGDMDLVYATTSVLANLTDAEFGNTSSIVITGFCRV